MLYHFSINLLRRCTSFTTLQNYTDFQGKKMLPFPCCTELKSACKEQIMLRCSYAMFCITCLYGLTRVAVAKSMESSKILLCAVLLWCSTPKGYCNSVWGNCFRHVLGLQDLTVIPCLILLCPYIYPHSANLCTAEGGALRLPWGGARAVLRLLGGARVSLHHKSITEEREVQVSLALQSPHPKVPTLGWQRIRMLLISKG